MDENDEPVPGVIVEAVGRRHICPYRTNKNGEYYLLLLPGTYTLNVSHLVLDLHSAVLLNMAKIPRQLYMQVKSFCALVGGGLVFSFWC